MADKTKVTRIKANDTKAKASKNAATDARPAKTTTPSVSSEPNEPKKNIFKRIGGYFKGAWIELKQVRWPTRKATWGLTIAVILFSLFFAVIILLLDTLFNYLFQQIIA